MLDADVQARGSRERLLLWSIRRCALGCGDPRVVEAALTDACGEREGQTAYVALRSLLIVLALHGRRRLALHPPCCPQRTADERSLLGLLTAAADGALAEVEARLAWLVRPTPAIDAVRLLSAAAAVLRPPEDVLQPGTATPGTATSGPTTSNARWYRTVRIEVDAASGLEHHTAYDPAGAQVVERRIDGR